MADGVITLWDVKKIVEEDSQSDIPLSKVCLSANPVHANGVAVSAIEFNPHKNTLLASGGSEVLI